MLEFDDDFELLDTLLNTHKPKTCTDNICQLCFRPFENICVIIADCFMMFLNTKYMIYIIITKTINMLSKSNTF